MMIIVFSYLSLFLLIVYSYTQVDLNLTLSSYSLYQQVQSALTHIGYFDRPTSSLLFLLCISILSGVYGFAVYMAYKKKLPMRIFLIILYGIVVSGILSYPAFSHDFFNYLFDARIVTQYRENPYTHMALEFPDDPWVRFMHWTHRTYPYGPMWLIVTLVPSFMGVGKFVLTMILFKIVFAGCYLVTIWCIKQCLSTSRLTDAPVSLVVYALNPLVIIESLVSPHNEGAMVAFLMLSIYYIHQKKNIWMSSVMLLLSIGVKYVTVVLIPLIAMQHKKVKEMGRSFYYWSVVLLCIPLAVEVWSREWYSWYLLPILAVGSIVSDRWLVSLLYAEVSIGSLLLYYPYLRYGDYGGATMLFQREILIGMVLIMSGTMFIANTIVERRRS